MKNLIIILILFFQFNTTLAVEDTKEKNLALMFIDKWMQEGTETCEEFGEGEFYLRFNPLQIMDITNDGVEDYILHETSGLCDTSASLFAGGTGGEHWRIYINPKIDNFNFDEYIDLWVINWKLTNYENQTALYIKEHGQVCDRAGYVGCYSTVAITSDGIVLLNGPIPGDQSSINIGTTDCYAEYETTIYINGECELYDHSGSSYPHHYILSHNLACDDGSDDCSYSFEIYNYNDHEGWSVNFSSGFDKRSKKMQEYLGDQFQVNLIEENGQKRLCAEDTNSRFCFLIHQNLKDDTFLEQINRLR